MFAKGNSLAKSVWDVLEELPEKIEDVRTYGLSDMQVRLYHSDKWELFQELLQTV